MALEKADLTTISKFVRETVQRLPAAPVKAHTIGTATIGTANVETAKVSGTIDAGEVTVNGLALPGSEIGYDQITASVNVTGTAEATPTIIIPGSQYVFDGQAVWAEFFTPQAVPPQVGSQALIIMLYDGTTELFRWGDIRNPTSANFGAWPQTLKYRFTPSAGKHTYSIRAFVSSTTGTPQIAAGNGGGVGTYPPAYLSLTKA